MCYEEVDWFFYSHLGTLLGFRGQSLPFPLESFQSPVLSSAVFCKMFRESLRISTFFSIENTSVYAHVHVQLTWLPVTKATLSCSASKHEAGLAIVVVVVDDNLVEEGTKP